MHKRHSNSLGRSESVSESPGNFNQSEIKETVAYESFFEDRSRPAVSSLDQIKSRFVSDVKWVLATRRLSLVDGGWCYSVKSEKCFGLGGAILLRRAWSFDDVSKLKHASKRESVLVDEMKKYDPNFSWVDLVGILLGFELYIENSDLIKTSAYKIGAKMRAELNPTTLNGHFKGSVWKASQRS